MPDFYSQFQSYTLGNGIPVHQLQIKDRPSQIVGFAFFAGNYHTRHQPGLAHFSEHILAGAAGSHQLGKEIREEAGYLWGGGGVTYNYSSMYGFSLPARNARFVPLVKRFREYLFENKLEYDLEGEKGPFTSEYKLAFGNKRSYARNQIGYHALRRGHWRTPTIAFGSPESIQSFTKEMVVGFCRDHYRPDNFEILTVGPLDRDEILKTFADTGWEQLVLAGTKNILPSAPWPISAPLIKNFAAQVDVATACDMHLQTIVPVSFSDEVLSIAASVGVEYLQDLLREKKRWVYGVHLQWDAYPDYKTLNFSASGVAPGNLGAFWESCTGALKDLAEGRAISSQDIERAKRRRIAATLAKEETVKEIFDNASHYIRHQLPIRTDAEWISRIEAISDMDIQKALALLQPANNFCALEVPLGVSAPAGIPLYDLYETQAALDAGHLPAPKA